MLKIIGDPLHVKTHRTRNTCRIHLWGCSLIPVTVSDLKAVFRCVPARLVTDPSLWFDGACQCLLLRRVTQGEFRGQMRGHAFQFLSYVSEEMLVVIFILRVASYSWQEIVRHCNQTVEPFILGSARWDVHDEATGCAGSAPERRQKRKKKSPCHILGMVPNIAQRHDSVT